MKNVLDKKITFTGKQLLIRNLLGSIVSLIAFYILVSNNDVVDFLKEVNEKKEALTVTLIALPIVVVAVITANLFNLTLSKGNVEDNK